MSVTITITVETPSGAAQVGAGAEGAGEGAPPSAVGSPGGTATVEAAEGPALRPLPLEELGLGAPAEAGAGAGDLPPVDLEVLGAAGEADPEAQEPRPIEELG